MVLTVTERPTVRALAVPDAEFWTMRGVELARLGYVLADGPERADVVVVPDRVPDALVAALRDAWSRLSPPRRFVSLESGLAGAEPGRLLAHAPPSRTSTTDHATEAGSAEGHHPGDMMAIVGDPSADGLVMEPIELSVGPLATALPGGLEVELKLDGDVVASCVPRALLEPPPQSAGGDPGSAAARAIAVLGALERARGEAASEAARRLRVAAVELERALGHAAWLRAFGRILGWDELAEHAQRAVAALTGPRQRAQRALTGASDHIPDELDRASDLRHATAAAAKPVDRLQRLLGASRRLRWRTRGRALAPRDLLASQPIGGPVARAAGLRRDARLSDDLYAALDFSVALREAGDAESRALIRAAEAGAAIVLALAALAETGDAAPGAAGSAGTPTTVEAARGPVAAILDEGPGVPTVLTPGASETLALAGTSVRGLELAPALVGLASFDLSPWSEQR